MFCNLNRYFSLIGSREPRFSGLVTRLAMKPGCELVVSPKTVRMKPDIRNDATEASIALKRVEVLDFDDSVCDLAYAVPNR